MNILQLCNKVPYPPIDGGAIATFNMTNGFKQNGNDVIILAINTSKHYFDFDNAKEFNPEINFIKFDNINITKDNFIENKINLIGVDVNTDIKASKALINLVFSRLPYNAERFISDNFKTALNQVLSQKQFDVIQLEGLYMTPYIDLIRKKSNALISMRAHNIEHEIWQRSAQQQTGLRKIYLDILSNRIRKFELSYLNKYDILVPITQRDENVYQEMGNKCPTKTIPTGIDFKNLANKNKDEKIDFPSLFHLGALDWPPNEEGLLWFLQNVWPNLLKEFPDIKFHIAGRNAPDWFIDKIMLKNIIYHGEVDDAYKFMRQNAIMIVPLLSGSGMRIKIIEGMALGKTIVTTAIGTEGINTTHNNNILIANTAKEYSNEIKNIILDKEKFNSIGSNAADFISDNYDNQKITMSLLEFYTNLIEN